MAVFRRVLIYQIFMLSLVLILVETFLTILNYFDQTEMGIYGLTGSCLGGIGISLVIAAIKFNQDGLFHVLKANCKNIKSLFLGVILINIAMILIGIVSYFIMKCFVALKISEFGSAWFVSSAVLLLFLCMLVASIGQLADNQIIATYSKFKITLIVAISLLGFSFLFYIIGYLFFNVSPMMAFLFCEILLLTWLIYFSHDVVKAIYLRMRRKLFFIGCALLTCFNFALAYGDWKFSKVPEFAFVQKHTWSFADIEKVKSLEEWILWQNKLTSLNQLTADEIIQSYEKLSQYCPPKLRDDPLYIECYSKFQLKDYQFTGVEQKTEEEVLKLLSAPLEYSQIMGILYARKLKKPLSRDMISAIEYISEKEGTLRGMARNTLINSYPANYKNTMVIKADPDFIQ